MTLTFGSLFSGIGGMDLGLERAGMRCAWQVEIDEYARRVLAMHWPDTARFADVRAVGAAELQRVDCIAGGFPCQDISNAGKRAGIDGERSGLWAEFARIIREVRPRYVLVENVAALLGRGLERVLGDLAASGFDAEWDCIPAAALGAPHRRDRLFLVAYAQRDIGRHESEPQPRRRRSPVARDDGTAQSLADTNSRRREGERLGGLLNQERETQRRHADGCGRAPTAYASGSGSGREGARIFRRPPEPSAWPAESGFCRVAHGVPARVDRLRGLGNAVAPQVAEYVGRLIVAHAGAA